MQREKRATRGKRMKQLIGEEEEKDKEFWGHGIWNEEDEEDFDAASQEEEDVVDSDFDRPDDAPDDKDDDDEEKTVRKIERIDAKRQKKQSYQDPKKAKPTTTKVTRRSSAPADSSSPRPAAPATTASTPPASPTVRPSTSPSLPPSPTPSSRSSSSAVSSQKPVRTRKRAAARTKGEDSDNESTPVRKSSRSATVEKTLQAEKRQQIRRESDTFRKPKKAVDVKRLTQEDLLAEAALTEQYNLAYLRELQKYDDEQKSKLVKKETVRTGEYIRFHSKDGVNLVTFSNFKQLPSSVKAPPVSYPKPAICAITGQPAKYFDPLTRQPYATIEAFKAIRSKQE